MVQREPALRMENAPPHSQQSSRVADVQGQTNEMLRGTWTVPPGEGRTAQAAHSRMREGIAAVGANSVRLLEEDRALTWKIKVDAQTSTPIRRATAVQLRGTATIPDKAAEEIAADSTDSRAAVIAHPRSPIARALARSRRVIVAGGSGSLPAANGRMTAPRHAEAIIAAGLRSS